MRMIFRLAPFVGAFLFVQVSAQETPPMPVTFDGITFPGEGSIYAPARELATALGLEIEYENGEVLIAGSVMRVSKRQLDGTVLMPIRSLETAGAEVVWDSLSAKATVTTAGASVEVLRRAKRVVIDKSTQTLEAFQGERLVMSTPVSTGKWSPSTPVGEFTAGPIKRRMHYSSLYNGAPMPYSVQVKGDVFIHGYKDVPPYPASHGCVRMPLTGGNAARWFFEWVDVGTPIEIGGEWGG